MLKAAYFYEANSLHDIKDHFVWRENECRQYPEELQDAIDSRYPIDNIGVYYSGKKYCLQNQDSHMWWFGYGTSYHYFGFITEDGKSHIFDCSSQEKTIKTVEQINRWIKYGKAVDTVEIELPNEIEFMDI